MVQVQWKVQTQLFITTRSKGSLVFVGSTGINQKKKVKSNIVSQLFTFKVKSNVGDHGSDPVVNFWSSS